MQRSAVLALASSRGDGEPELLIESGVSGADRSGAGVLGGTGRGGRRTTYHQLRARIEADEVSALYAYSLSRLARSTRELLDLTEVCVAHSVPIRLAKEGDIDGRSPSGRLYLTVLAAVATFEAEVASERGKDRTASMRDRGAHVGQAPFGWQIGPAGALIPDPAQMPVVERVLSLYAIDPSPARVAKALNAEGIPPPFGDRPSRRRGTTDDLTAKWGDGTVRRIMARQPGSQPPKTVRGSRAVPVARFARLLVCACGGWLTPTRKGYVQADGTAKTWTGYTCSRARYDPGHPSPKGVAEAALWPFVEAEWARFREPEKDATTPRRDIAGQLVELEARRSREVEMRADGVTTREQARERITAIDDQLTALRPPPPMVTRLRERDGRMVPVVELNLSFATWDAAELNGVLRSLWRYIKLDDNMLPVRAEWIDPAWRASEEEDWTDAEREATRAWPARRPGRHPRRTRPGLCKPAGPPAQ